MERSRLSIGSGGWVRFMASDLPAAVYVRYEDRGGRLVAVELYVDPLEGAPVSPDLLRQVPLGRIDAYVNADASKGLLRVGVTDEHGKAMRGYDASSARAVRMDRVRARCAWKTHKDVSSLRGKTVRLRFELTDASVFAFWCE